MPKPSARPITLRTPVLTSLHRMYTEEQKRTRVRENREYRKRNPGKVKCWQREYYQRHKERITAQNREHYACNRQRILDSQRKYKSKKLTGKQRLTHRSNKQRIYLTLEEREKRILFMRRKRYHKNREAQIARVQKRKKNLGFNQLNQAFPDCVWHHVTDDDVVAIPKHIHRASSDITREKHQQRVLDYYGSLENMIKQPLVGHTNS